MLQVIPSFITNNSKNSLFISVNKNENYIVCKEYCIVHDDDNICFQPICRYQVFA